MSNKKSLLTESEIRRFMKLANIPALKEGMYGEGGGQIPQDPRHAETVRSGDEERMAEAMPSIEEEDEMPELDGAGGEEETMELGDEMGAGEEISDELATKVVQAVLTALGKEGEVSSEEASAQEPPSEEGEEEAGEEAGEEGEEEAGEEGEEEAGEEGEEEMEESQQQELQESKVVEAVLARVTARLIAEAKKSKKSAAEKKKKEEEAKKKKEAVKKKAAAAKKKLEEANAPAPKSTTSNASAAGVAKGHGPGSKAWGTDEKKSMKWKEGKGEKGHEMESVAASSEHTVSHGKKNLATQGSNKKK